MHSLVVLVMHDPSRLPELVSAWCDAGAPAVTIIDSVGANDSEERQWSDDLPVLPSLRDLQSGGETPSKTLFSVVPDRAVDTVIGSTTEVMGDLSELGKGILFVMPIARVVGLRDNEMPKNSTA